MVDLKVWGEYACFTRPEFKVERVSYPVMTPSAARGVLEAIYWKPQMRYRIHDIGILKFGLQTSILRNEISDRQSPPRRAGGGPIRIEQKRQQRSSLILKDVCYRIRAWIDVQPGSPHGAGKHLACFSRRAESGACFHRPYFGCREFAADFEPAAEADAPMQDLSLDLGPILFEIAYIEARQEPKTDLEFYRHETIGGRDQRRIVQGRSQSLMFHGKIESGWLTVPQARYVELDELEGRKWDS